MFTERVARSGITFSRLVEWRLAAHWDGYRWRDFMKLDGEEQSAIVATYRAYNQIEAVASREQSQAIRNGAKG